MTRAIAAAIAEPADSQADSSLGAAVTTPSAIPTATSTDAATSAQGESAASITPSVAAAGEQTAGEPAAVAVPATPAVPELSNEELLQRALITALHESVRDRDLPMLVATLTAQHVYPTLARLKGAPEGGVNLKQTRWKKLGIFLGELQDSGLLKIAEGKPGVQSLMQVSHRRQPCDVVVSLLWRQCCASIAMLC